ncbi:MAG: hypothetical protein BWY59_01779 [Verrucomicrobia bacterium ADurb.Bin345]|nr:MAG: hypothetical protein BWY59_01779 [Verrucomicrobia bacterium ADurb.Bin345]
MPRVVEPNAVDREDVPRRHAVTAVVGRLVRLEAPDHLVRPIRAAKDVHRCLLSARRQVVHPIHRLLQRVRQRPAVASREIVLRRGVVVHPPRAALRRDLPVVRRRLRVRRVYLVLRLVERRAVQVAGDHPRRGRARVIRLLRGRARERVRSFHVRQVQDVAAKVARVGVRIVRVGPREILVHVVVRVRVRVVIRLHARQAFAVLELPGIRQPVIVHVVIVVHRIHADLGDLVDGGSVRLADHQPHLRAGRVVAEDVPVRLGRNRKPRMIDQPARGHGIHVRQRHGSVRGNGDIRPVALEIPAEPVALARPLAPARGHMRRFIPPHRVLAVFLQQLDAHAGQGRIGTVGNGDHLDHVLAGIVVGHPVQVRHRRMGELDLHRDRLWRGAQGGDFALAGRRRSEAHRNHPGPVNALEAFPRDRHILRERDHALHEVRHRQGVGHAVRIRRPHQQVGAVAIHRHLEGQHIVPRDIHRRIAFPVSVPDTIRNHQPGVGAHDLDVVEKHVRAGAVVARHPE